MAEHEDLVLAVGPYLLGALDGDTRRRLRDHLETCGACQAEVIRLAGVPGLMAQVGPPNLRERAEAEPSPNLRERLVNEVVAERAGHRRRQQVLSAAAALLLVALPAGAFVSGRSLEGSQPEIAVSDEVALTTASAQLTGTVSWSAHGWGAELYPEITGLEPGQEYELIAISRDGNTDVVMTWSGAEGLVNPIGTMSITEDNLARLIVRRTDAPGEELLWLDTGPAPTATATAAPSAAPALGPGGEPVPGDVTPGADGSTPAASAGAEASVGGAGGEAGAGVAADASRGGPAGGATPGPSATGPSSAEPSSPSGPGPSASASVGASVGVPPVSVPLPSLPPVPLPSPSALPSGGVTLPGVPLP